MELPRRPSLGQWVGIGTLYDARSDTFLSTSLLNDNFPEDAITKIASSNTSLEVSSGDSYEKRFKLMGVPLELGTSVLAGLTQPEGCSTFLIKERKAGQAHQYVLSHKILTVQENLNMASSAFHGGLDHTRLKTADATHIVSSVEWGAQTILSMAVPEGPTPDESAVDEYIRSQVEKFQSLTRAIPSQHVSRRPVPSEQALHLEIVAHSDVLSGHGIVLSDVDEAANFVNNIVPLDIKHKHQGRGRPVTYTLLPLNFLSLLTGSTHIVPPVPQINTMTLQNFFNLFDQFGAAHKELSEYCRFIAKHKRYIPEDDSRKATDAFRQFQKAKEQLKSQYSTMILQVRCGTAGSDILDKLYHDMKNTLEASQNVLSKGVERQKVSFIASVVKKGGLYIGHNGPDLQAVMHRQPRKDFYVLYLNANVMKHDQNWPSNQQIISDVLQDGSSNSVVVLVDCDATKQEVSKTRIAIYRGGQETTHDLLDRHEFLADKCFATYREDTLEAGDSIRPPLKRGVVKVACPCPNCDTEKICEWLCPYCEANLEFGYADHYIYCACGRTSFSNYDFRCNNPSHGNDAAYYDPNVLLALLKSLDQSDYLNVLILGETGVGKSTFVNAFINYVSFETLDDALKADLNYVVPCSFSAQIMDKSNPDGEIEEFRVQVGSRDDEKDGSKGESATQKTSVHAIQIGSKTIRLIDTPGMGDTRGLEYDQKNMADILNTISSYDKLHGIIILLKSNNARLTVTFNFCVSELLTHLHRSAAANMVFGFTNTRISNYTPGDTFGPLKTILQKHSGVGLSLSSQTTYCFDSESFRYLAAFKEGHNLGNIDDFRRSWQYSRDETLRLVEHFQKKPPHSVQSTLIRTNLSLCEDKRKELDDTQLSGDALRKRLQVEKVHYESITLLKPRTVCKNSLCIEYRDNGQSTGTQVAIYKTICHRNCNRPNVTPDQQGHPNLYGCAAFNGEMCTHCGHFWQDHMHVTYELKERKVMVTDTAVRQQLRMHADDVSLRTAAIHDLDGRISEYQSEHGEIQKAAAMFGLFLKKYSITPYNDATLEYLDMLIKDEKGKIHAAQQQGMSASGNQKRLEAIESDRQRHVELVETLTTTMNDTNSSQQPALDPTGVDRLVKKLYGLKHFGHNLKTVKNTIALANESTYRERPYRVNRGGVSGGYRRGYDVFYMRHAATGAPRRSTSTTLQLRQRGMRSDPGRNQRSILSSFKFW
ncbi:hypothetical protein F4776DRAFT_524361 [Hypoxylon sp. NC0597]|nr:hypothetical protein F4776DRAFT_524361 [Hypoxylon sp. NC0597]